MPSLPADRTKLALAQGNQVPSAVIASAKNINSITEAYDTIDMLYNYINGFVTSGTLSPLPPDFLFRNVLINPFEVWQRGTSFTTTGYGADRWYFDLSNATASKQTAGSPVGSQNYSRMTMTALGAGNYYQALESDIAKKINGKTVTFSVKLRKNASFVSDINLIVQKNATADTLLGGTWTAISSTVVLTSSIPTGTTSAEWYTATVTASIPNDGTANGIRVFIQQVSSQNTGAYYEVSQADMSVSTTVLPFQPRSFAEELSLCLRYYEKSYRYDDAPGTAVSSGVLTATANDTGGNASLRLPFKVSKRTVPTVTYYKESGTLGSWQHSSNGAAYADFTPTTDRGNENGFGVFKSGGVAGQTVVMLGHFTADAEI